MNDGVDREKVTEKNTSGATWKRANLNQVLKCVKTVTIRMEYAPES